MTTLEIMHSAEQARRSTTWDEAARRASGPDASGLLALQRLAGNRAVAGLVAKGLTPEAGQVLRSVSGPHSPLMVQRVLSIGKEPVDPKNYEQARAYCQQKFEELKAERLKTLEADAAKTAEAKANEKKTIEAELTWTANLAAKLKEIIDHRIKSYSADSPAKLVEAFREYAVKNSFPAWFAGKDVGGPEAEKAHQRRQELRYWRVNKPASEQMPEEASAFHQLGESDVAPLQDYGYRWTRKRKRYHLTQERGQTPEAVRFQPFGVNSLDEKTASPGQVFGYNVNVGSGSSRQLPFGLIKVLQGVAKGAPEREGKHEAYGGWELLKGMTRGHMNPQWLNAPVLDKRPNKRMRSADWRGDETFVPKMTSESPLNFYPENMAFGQSIRKFTEGKVAKSGGTLKNYNLYGAAPGTVESQVEGKGGGAIEIPYPDQVILDVALPKSAEFYKGEKLDNPGRFTAKFPNAPEINYASGTVDPTTKKMEYETFTGDVDTNERKKLRGRRTGGGAREHFKGNVIPATEVPTADIFEPKSFRTYKPAGDYGPTEKYEPAHRHSVPGYMSPPGSPLIHTGAREETVTLDGEHHMGEETPEGDRIIWADYDRKKDKTTCEVVRYKQADPASWT